MREKFILLAVITLLAALIFGGYAVFFKKETREQCFARLDKSGETGLANQALQRGIDEQVLILRHFNCELSKGKESVSYTEIKDFIGKTSLGQMEKEESYTWFEDIVNNRYVSEIQGVAANIALGEYGKICPDNLRAMCFNKASRLVSSDKVGDISKYCDNLCAALAEYEGKEESFNKALQTGEADKVFMFDISGKEWKQKMLTIYRFDGQEAALIFCDTLKDETEKKNCETNIKIRIEDQKYSCDEVVSRIKELACTK